MAWDSATWMSSKVIDLTLNARDHLEVILYWPHNETTETAKGWLLEPQDGSWGHRMAACDVKWLGAWELG